MMVGHLNSFSASGVGNLKKNFPKIQMPGGVPGGMFKPRFDWYIIYFFIYQFNFMFLSENRANIRT